MGLPKLRPDATVEQPPDSLRLKTFFVNCGGWDHYSDTLPLQEAMLQEVDEVIGAFWSQLVALGIENQVTLFSASDFGRTLTSNDLGSDHAWGGNHFDMGGSVVGKTSTANTRVSP